MTLTIAGPTTVPSLIGREVTDERGLSLAQAPAHIIRKDYRGGEVRYTLVLGETLGRRGLMDLLYTLAPYKAHGPDRFPRVLDNWALHDRARTSSGSEALLLQHVKSLGFSWQEFARHRELFIEVLEDQSDGRRVIPALCWTKDATGRRHWRFDGLDEAVLTKVEELAPSLLPADTPGRPQLDSLVGLVTIPYFLPELRKNWRAWQPLVKDGKSNYIGPASVPVISLMHRRALLGSRLIKCAEAYVDR